MFAKKFLAACLLCVTFAGAPALADDAKEAGAFADQLGHAALAAITDQSASKADKQARLEKLFADNFDIDWIAQFVLGRNWKAASDAQKQDYLASYRTFIIKHYTSNLSDYTDTNFEVAKVQPADNGGDVVTIRIKRPNAEDLMAQYTIRRNAQGQLRIYDMVVEGVSMITTQRSEFSSVVSQKGLDYLIAQLKSRAQSDQGVVKDGQL